MAYSAIVKHLQPFILSDDYVFNAPDHALWSTLVVRADANERDRMEFFGDTILHMLTAMELRTLYPQGTPGLYTCISQAVNSNHIFALLMNKGKILKAPGKQTADAFETMVAALYIQSGIKAAQQWFAAQFRPLLQASKEAFDHWTKNKPVAKHKAKKRSTASLKTKASPIALAFSAKKRALRDQRLSNQTPSRVLPHKTPFKISSRGRGLITFAKPALEIIDLTNSPDDSDNTDDWEDEEDTIVQKLLSPVPKVPTGHDQQNHSDSLQKIALLPLRTSSSSSHTIETPQTRRPPFQSSIYIVSESTPSKGASKRPVPPPRPTALLSLKTTRTPKLGSSLRPIMIDDSDSD